MTRIGDQAFYYCSGLTSATIGNGVTSIGDHAFYNCSGLTSVTIPDGVTSIGGYAFYGCSSLTSVTIPDGVTSIGDDAFRGCSGLTSATIGNGVTSIGDSAFYNCRGLTSVTIGNGVTSIGDQAFYGCSGLKAVYISDLAAWCRISFSSDYSNPLSYAHNLYLNGTLVTDVTIPDGVTSIGMYAFYDCRGLTDVTIPNGVTSIGSYAFQYCRSLTNMTFEGNAPLIGTDAIPFRCVAYVKPGSTGWGVAIPGTWNGLRIEYANCTVTLDRQGGSGGPSSVTATYGSAMPSITVPARTGYTFGGYYTGTDGTGTQYYTDAGTSARPWDKTDAATLYAKWTAVPVTTYTVTYKPGAYGTGAQQTATKTKDAALMLMGAIFTRPGYTQTGWATSDGGTKVYDLSASYTANAAVTLYPFWAANTYTVTLDRKGGSGGPSSVTATYGGAMPSITVPTRTGYTFGGYYTGTDGTGTQYYTDAGTSARTWSIANATTLYAKWTAVSVTTYTVTYNPGLYGTGAQQTATKTKDVALTLKDAIFTCTGYTQTGWATSDGGTKVYDLSASYTANAAVTLYPFWAANTYTVTLDRKGGSGGPSSVTATYGGAMPSITVPTRTGYTFGGYYTGTDGTGTQYYTDAGTSARTWSIANATTLYAKWTAVSVTTYTVTYNPGSYGVGSAQTATKTKDVALTLKGAVFTRTGYTQTGWATSDGGTKAYNLGASYTANAAITLYPFWTANTYTVTLDRQNGSGGASSVTATYGSAMPSITVPTRNGYTFGGYYTGTNGSGTLYYTSSGASARTWNIAGATTLYAKWTEVPTDGGTDNGSGDGSGIGPGDGTDAGAIGGTVQPWTAAKAVTLDGAVYDAEGNVAGVIQLKVAKPNAKKHNAKVSGSVTLLDGKKRTMKAATVNVPSDKPISANVSVKGLGTLSLTIGDDGFEGSVGGYSIAAAKVGGAWTQKDARVTVATSATLPAGTVESLLPNGEPVRVKGGKWAFDKAASITYKKGVLGGDSDPKKPNRSAMKLTYTPKTGLFKGSFKVYAVQGGKLKKYTVKVTGVVVDGEGTGVGKLAKPAASWSVSVR